MKRSRLVLVVILVAVTALCVSLWVGEGPLWRLVMLKRIYTDRFGADGSPVRGWYIVKRWPGEDPSPGRKTIFYYRETGFIETEVEKSEVGAIHVTEYSLDGSVRVQHWGEPLHFGFPKTSPPWLWDVADPLLKQVWLAKAAYESKFRPGSHHHGRNPRSGPPWWWGVTDQTEPTAPWWGKE